MTKLSKNLIYFTLAVVIFIGVLIYGIYLWRSQQLESISFTVTILGSDYNNAAEEVYLSGFQILMRNAKDGKEKTLLTDDLGKSVFNVKPNSDYYLTILPSGTTSFLYVVPPPNLTLKFDTTKDVKKQFRLALKEETVRDIQRRKDLTWVYMPALEQFKEKNGYYPKIAFEKIDSKGQLAKFLSEYISNIPLDPLSGHFYEYYSDGKTYKLIAYPEIDFRGNLLKAYKDQKVYLIGNNSEYVSYLNIVKTASKINLNYIKSLVLDIAKFIFPKTEITYAGNYYDGGGGKCTSCYIEGLGFRGGGTYCVGEKNNCGSPEAGTNPCGETKLVSGCLVGKIWCSTCKINSDGSCSLSIKCSGSTSISASSYCSGCQSAGCGQCSTVEACTTSDGKLGGWRCNCTSSVGGGLYESCKGFCDSKCTDEGNPNLRCVPSGDTYRCQQSSNTAYSNCSSGAVVDSKCGCDDYNDPGKGGLNQPCTSCGCRDGLYCCPTKTDPSLYACYKEECGTSTGYKCNVCNSQNKCPYFS